MGYSRRDFLMRVGQAGGYSAAFLTMQSMGLMGAKADILTRLDVAPGTGICRCVQGGVGEPQILGAGLQHLWRYGVSEYGMHPCVVSIGGHVLGAWGVGERVRVRLDARVRPAELSAAGERFCPFPSLRDPMLSRCQLDVKRAWRTSARATSIGDAGLVRVCIGLDCGVHC